MSDRTPARPEVTPYSEVYGIHPRLFVFDRNYYMVPSGLRAALSEIGAYARFENNLLT